MTDLHNEWRSSTWGNEISLEYGKSLRDYSKEAGRYRVFGSNGPIGWHAEKLTDGPGIVLGRKGAYRGVRFSIDPFFVIDTAYYVRPKSALDMRWLYYAIIHHKLGEIDDGSPIPSTTRAAVYVRPVEIPDISEQQAISAILGSLDDRIELLKKTNETLEAMARTIFKSWFVDFDPVRAKTEGREPEGMDAATAALFPSEFQDTELGPIPLGWNVGRLDDLFVLQRGFDLPNSQRVDGEFPVIAASGPSGTHSEFKVKGPGVVTGRSGVLGNVFYVHDDFWPLNTSLWVKEFRSASPLYSYRVLQRMDLKIFNAGSAVPTLNRNHVHGLPTLLPPRGVLVCFDGLVFPIHQRMRMTESQILMLQDLRDTLLPRLISGKLRVPEAEAMLAEAL